VTFSQYWNAWTKVIDRMPPAATVVTTTTATMNSPTHRGAPVTVRSVRPAPWNCGIRYSQQIRTTRMLARARRRADPRRSSVKSGSV
jgi:hypothetical protein